MKNILNPRIQFPFRRICKVSKRNDVQSFLDSSIGFLTYVFLETKFVIFYSLLLFRLNELDETPKTTEDSLTRIAIALEEVAASLKLQGTYWSVKQ